MEGHYEELLRSCCRWHAERAALRGQEQADLVRGLKAKLTNEDAEVKEAVTVLLERKAALEALQQAS